MAFTMFDNLPLPPAARLLGWKLIAVDPKAGTRCRICSEERIFESRRFHSGRVSSRNAR